MQAMASLAFQGKKAIVTGAGSGLGRFLAKSLKEKGAKVYALSKTQERLESLKKECPEIETVAVDLSKYEDTRRILGGIEPVDMVVNNAAINIPGYMMDITHEDFVRSMEVNVLTPMNVIQLTAKKMIDNKIPGSIVNISSIVEKRPISRQGLYGASKSALGSATKNFAKELGVHNIRLNNVCPGLFPSEMSKKALNNPKSRMVALVLQETPFGRIGTVDEIANVVMFLLHESSSYVHGQSIFVCGGLIT